MRFFYAIYMQKPHGLTKFTPDILPTLDALKQQGRTYHSIAFATGVSIMTAYRAINRLGTYRGMK